MRMLSLLAAMLVLLILSPVASARAWVDGQIIDPNAMIRKPLLERAIASWQNHAERIRRAEMMVVVDYARHSSQPRLYLVNMQSGRVAAYHVAHGRGSDADHDGWLDGYSNTVGSNANSRGAYVGAERYWGKHGQSLRLEGLEADNSNARDRAIVLHAQPRYVSAQFLGQHGKLGRSNGCLVVYKDALETVMSALELGAFLFVDGARSNDG